MELRLRNAETPDLAALLALLDEANLPAAGVSEWLAEFLVAEVGAELVGAAGLEVYASGALLRSVVVAPAWKGRGVGGALVEAALKRAQRAGRLRVYLLTTTAEQYFPRYGFRAISRSDVPEDVQQSVEFRDACPASALVMMKDLGVSSEGAAGRRM
jgi:amino-acid N-acetyltransferase